MPGESRSPFYIGMYCGITCEHTDAVSRLHAVAKFDLATCRRALRFSGLQKTVRTAIERRLRKLMKEKHS